MRLGLIAGNGQFPFLVLEAAKRLGHELTVVGIQEEADSALEKVSTKHHLNSFHWVSLGQLGKCIEILTTAGASRALMAGQVRHTKLFAGVVPDRVMLATLARALTKNTDALISAVADTFGEHGIELVDSTSFLGPLLAKEGLLTSRELSEAQRTDLEFGYEMADAVARLDIGQTIAVKDQAVVAIEAMEGTDAVIARAGQLAGAGVRVIKVAKPKQDMRFDVPVVGIPTIHAMQKVDANVLSVDAGVTLVIGGERVIEEAEKAGIVVVGRARKEEGISSIADDV